MKELKLIFGLLLVSIPTLGCDCIMTSLEDEVQWSEYVLKVKVIGLLDTKEELIEFYNEDINNNKGYRARVKVTTIYKGVLEEKEIDLATNYTNCEPYYELNKEYLLFIEKTDNGYFIIPCTSWTKLDKSVRTTLRQIKRITKK